MLREITDRHGRKGCCLVTGAKELRMRNRFMLCGCNLCDVRSTARNAQYNVPHDFLVLLYLAAKQALASIPGSLLSLCDALNEFSSGDHLCVSSHVK